MIGIARSDGAVAVGAGGASDGCGECAVSQPGFGEECHLWGDCAGGGGRAVSRGDAVARVERRSLGVASAVESGAACRGLSADRGVAGWGDVGVSELAIGGAAVEAAI